MLLCLLYASFHFAYFCKIVLSSWLPRKFLIFFFVPLKRIQPLKVIFHWKCSFPSFYGCDFVYLFWEDIVLQILWLWNSIFHRLKSFFVGFLSATDRTLGEIRRLEIIFALFTCQMSRLGVVSPHKVSILFNHRAVLLWQMGDFCSY